MSNFIGQNDFLAQVERSFNSLYGLDAVFTVIALQVAFSPDAKYRSREALGVLSAAIAKAIVKEGDFYSFYDNKFYVLTCVENKKVIHDFVKSLASKLNTSLGQGVSLFASFAQYPYDALNSKELFDSLVGNMGRVDTRFYDAASGLITDQNPNQQMGNALTQFLYQIKLYSDVLYTHSLCVARISLELAKSMNFANQAIKNIVVAAILHDLGYTLISKEIYLGSRQVKAKNAMTIKLHPFLASRKILADNLLFRNVLDLIEQHHEYMDGGGYPLGLSRENLTMESQILSIADTYALIKEQPNLSLPNIIEFFTARAGFRWDEKLVDILVKLLNNEEKRDVLLKETVSLNDLFNFA